MATDPEAVHVAEVKALSGAAAEGGGAGGSGSRKGLLACQAVTLLVTLGVGIGVGVGIGYGVFSGGSGETDASAAQAGVSAIALATASSFSPFYQAETDVSWEYDQMVNLYRQNGNKSIEINQVVGGVWNVYWVDPHTGTTVHEFPTAEALEACDFSVATELKGPSFPHYYKLAFPEEGQRFFSCAFPGHCEGGWKIAVNVTSLSGPHSCGIGS